MSLTGLCFTVVAALLAASSNILLRLGLIRAGGFGISDQSLVRDLMRLACEPAFVGGLALYGFAVFGYVTATLATFFVGRDAADKESELAGTADIRALRDEIALLRSEIGLLRN